MMITCVSVVSWNESTLERTFLSEQGEVSNCTISTQFAFTKVMSYLCRAIERRNRIVQRKCE
jgi:hypothetical protein